MCGIKIPQQDFALKMQGGGLMREGGGGIFAGHYMYGIHDSCLGLHHSIASFPGHSQILSHSCGIKSVEGLVPSL